MKSSNLWLRFGCFLTGYNYSILANCSEVAAKTVKRFTSALIIVSLMWAFIGFNFANRYLKAGFIGSLLGAILFVIIIIQVERQIILAIHRNVKLYIFRGIIATLMALVGSIIIDQIIFKEDIEQQKILLLDEKVKQIYPSKAYELNSQIKNLDSTIMNKEQERSIFNSDIAKNPTIKVVTESTQSTTVPVQKRDSLGLISQDTKVVSLKNVNTNFIANPKIAMMKDLDTQLSYLRGQKSKKDSLLLTLRPRVEEEIKSKVGFLDELNVMVRLLSVSTPALIVWIIWLLFLLGLELFILMSKSQGETNDYDSLIFHQMHTNMKRIELLNKKNDSLLEGQ